MNSGETSPPANNDENVDVSRIEAMVTPEQVFSANVARKRRNLTRKQSSHLKSNREHTPVSERISDTDRNTDKPERPQRKTRSIERNGINTSSFKKDASMSRRSQVVRNSEPKDYAEDLMDPTENLSKPERNEFEGSLNEGRIISSPAQHRQRFQKKKIREQSQRSQSVPYEFTEDELMASFYDKKMANSIEDNSVLRRLSDSTPYDQKENSKTLRPEVQELIRKRREMRSRHKSNISSKIIEILDPKTKDILCSKTKIQAHVGVREIFFILRFFRMGEIRMEYKKFKQEMKEDIKRITTLRNRCFNELFVIILFCGIGGFMFKFTEGAFENFYKCGVKRVKRDFIDLLWVRSHTMREDEWKSLARNRLRIFEEEIHEAHEAGMKSYSGRRSWSFLNGIVYSITLISTIGYGHIYPTTMTGRALTIVYSLIGIPLFLLALTDFGKLFTRCIKFLWSFVRRLYYTGSCKKVRKQAQVQEIFKGAQMMYDIATFRRPSAIWDPENPPTCATPQETPTTPALSNFEIDDQFNLPISVAIFILLMYIICGAFFYGFMEGWNFFQSFYFVFISMSTIGFGDVVPNNPLCTIISIVYLVFGLALMSMCINVVQEKLSDTFKSASAKIGASLGVTMAAEDGSIITIPPDQVEMPQVHIKNVVEITNGLAVDDEKLDVDTR